ncbi:MAG: DNA gyrase inhibitor YacG [Nannocystaceae bacterium]
MKIRCPSCRRELKDVPEDFPHRPFCSNRCKMADLSNWLDENYRISRPVGFDDDGLDPQLTH